METWLWKISELFKYHLLENFFALLKGFTTMIMNNAHI